jgi:hypothetical protein
MKIFTLFFLLLFFSVGINAQEVSILDEVSSLPLNDILTGSTGVGFLAIAFKIWRMAKNFIPLILEHKEEIKSIKNEISVLRRK